MPLSSPPVPQPAPPPPANKCFGLRIENTLLQLAIATPLADGRYRLEIDEIPCAAAGGWLTAAGITLLKEAVNTFVERHDIRRRPVAVSLDGDFCVTRVTMGTSEEVNRELSMLADRVPRYLQLGPGEKFTGSSRKKIAPTVDYAVTGVVSRSLIQRIYDALRATDIELSWIEPSLVSVARLIGQARIGGDQPVMIADGTGRQWDVGIACTGRLLLDYRPAAATTEEAFRDALDGHISRLQRFCQRHRRIATGELSQLLICGTSEKANRAVSILGDSLGVQPSVLKVPELPELYEIDPSNRDSRCVPVVATVLPLLVGVPQTDVPDLLQQVYRAPKVSWTRRAVHLFWPVAAACLILSVSYGLVTSGRKRVGKLQDRAEFESMIDATEVRFADLTQKREWGGYLKEIQRLSSEPNWDDLLEQITQSLPDSAKLNEFRIESDGRVLLDGTVLDEPVMYELVNQLRLLPAVTQVALKGTTPDGATQGTRFVIGLMTARIGHPPTFGTYRE